MEKNIISQRSRTIAFIYHRRYAGIQNLPANYISYLIPCDAVILLKRNCSFQFWLFIFIMFMVLLSLMTSMTVLSPIVLSRPCKVDRYKPLIRGVNKDSVRGGGGKFL